MSDLVHENPPARDDAPVLRRLSTLDRFLPVWIVAAMALGLALGRAVPGLDDALARVEIGSVSLPIAVGLLVMMYPVLAKVRYDELGHVTTDKRLLASSILLNWILGPAVMFALAWLMLPDLPAYRTGLIIVGLARCIAMVLIWNDLACGDREAAAILVALNSLFQIVAFAGLGYFYLQVLPGWLHLPQTTGLDVSVWGIAKSVLIFLGIPLAAGFLTRRLGENARGRDWYEARLLPMIGPAALYGLLFTIVVLFALQGDTITNQPLDVARIAVPLLAYFALMWVGSFFLGKHLGMTYERTTTLAFTAAGNNFELAIAVAIGVFGVTSGQALAGVVGPLIEVPVLVGLVYVALWLRRRYYPDHFLTSRPGRPPRRQPVERDTMSDKPTVLFVCIHNAGRSQMAAGYLQHVAGDRIDVLSAGSRPGTDINPVAVQAMAEEGIDIAGNQPKSLTREAVQTSDVVITMGCGDECPFYPGKRYEDWELDDPAGQDIDAVRPIRDEIKIRVQALVASLGT